MIASSPPARKFCPADTGGARPFSTWPCDKKNRASLRLPAVLRPLIPAKAAPDQLGR